MKRYYVAPCAEVDASTGKSYRSWDVMERAFREGTLRGDEATAKRAAGGGLNFDTVFQVWPNRASMARSIRMQQKREHRPDDWRACVPLTDGEGY